MFDQLRNIETAFKHIKLFSFVLIAACVIISCFAIYESEQQVNESHKRIFLLANGKALEAFSADRKDNVPVEARDHIKMFHYFFFTLDPDDKLIDDHIGQALYLADASAKKQYDDLKESGYYTNIISGNISQQITLDSITLNMNDYPYSFKYYGKERLIRPTATINRTMVTEGYIRNVGRSDNNAHGFLIERWRIIENKDIDTLKR